MTNLFKRIIGSRYFLATILSLFTLHGIWTATTIKYGIPADEVYHYQLTNLYAQRSLTAGPVIKDQGASTFYLGDLQQEPNFLYHYLLSFPLKAFHSLGGSEQNDVLFLRLVNLLIAIGSLLLLVRIIRNIGGSSALANATVFLTALTGMFAWISAAINYDNLSILLFFGLLLYLIKFLTQRRFNDLLLALIFAASSVITKVTISPSVLLVIVLSGVYLILRRRSGFWQSVKQSAKTPLAIFLVIILLLVTAMFCQRIIGNKLTYGTISPKCDVVHSIEECSNSAIYRRDANQKIVYQQIVEQGAQPTYQPMSFTKQWLTMMHDRLYFYFGHKTLDADSASHQTTLVLAGLVTLSLLLLIVNRRWPYTVFDGAVALIVIAYIAELYYFNLHTYLSKGFMAAFQGRYLLPVLPFIYYLMLKLFSTAGQFRLKMLSSIYTMVCLVVIGWFCWAHLPPLVFLKYSNADWYTEKTASFNGNLANSIQKYFGSTAE